jgi:FKBP-type peptidyl-prolyl cis-trans isomerase
MLGVIFYTICEGSKSMLCLKKLIIPSSLAYTKASAPDEINVKSNDSMFSYLVKAIELVKIF